MAEESGAERTEAATEKRLGQAREDGDIPRSRELSTFAVLMTAGGVLWLTGSGVARQLADVLRSGLALDREQIFNPDVLFHRIAVDIVNVMLACMPLAAAIVAVAVAAPVMIGGWLFTTKILAPNFGKFNPINGLVNMVSTNALVELLKAVAKTLLVGSVAWFVVMSQKEAVIGLAVEPPNAGTIHMVHLIGVAFLVIVAGLGLIAALDAPYQLWHYANKHKMTRQEVIQESKESDGNPQIKGKIRQLQREMAKSRMMANVPKADVVVTNPTHYAVALQYQDGQRGAPRVIAKGVDEVAAKIREIARENKVAMLEAPPLARALYKHTEIDDEIPEQLYAAVAEVLAYVFQLRSYSTHGGLYPDRPTTLAVPPEMDPLDPASRKQPGTPDGASE
jgi:flagellar biosynthetic protein FlhB